MLCVKCGNEIAEGAAFCSCCGAKVARGGGSADTPIYQADIKTLLKSGRLVVYRDRTEFVTSSVQKAIFNYTGLVSVKKNLTNGIDFLTEDGRTETCPADRKCVHEALVHIEQAARVYIEQRRERLLSQGVRYSFASSQGLMNSGVLNLSAEQAEFRAKTGKTDVVLFQDVKSVSMSGGMLTFLLFGRESKAFAVGRELADEVLAFVTDSVAPYLAQRKEALLARGIYFSSEGPEGVTLDILADRAELKNRLGQVESAVSFQDVRTAGVYGGMLELALTDGTSKSFPIEDDIGGQVLDFVQRAMEPYVAARTVGFDTAFGAEDRIEFNGQRGVFHLIRQGGREITGEWPIGDLVRCQWTEDKNLTALGSVVTGGIGLIQRTAKATGSQAAGETEEKIGSVDVVLTIAGQEILPQSVCFGRSPVGMGRTDKKYSQCLTEWAGLSEYLAACCPGCQLVEPVIPEMESALPETAVLPAIPRPERAELSVAVTEPENVITVQEAPARRDDSGIAKYIEGVSRFIGNCSTPMTIAFQGNRGSGRSSTLGMLCDWMEDHGDNLLWLNARQFPQGETGEALSLLVGRTLMEPFKTESAAVKQTGTLLTGLAGLATGIIVKDTSLGKEIAGGMLNKNAASAQEYSPAAFAREIEARAKNGKVVFFIDGLNQLDPARAVELLDAMRDFFDCRGCVFVVAADYANIFRGAQAHYDENKAKRFFDNIFKMAFRVPASSLNLQGYAKGKLEDMGVRAQDDAELELYAALLQSSVGRDMEALDRLFSSFSLLKDLTGGEVYADRYKRLALFALLCMQARFRNAYNYAMERRDSVTPAFLEGLCGQSAQPWAPDQTEEAAAAYRAFGGAFAQVVNLDDRAEISPAECQAFAQVLELSSVTSR